MKNFNTKNLKVAAQYRVEIFDDYDNSTRTQTMTGAELKSFAYTCGHLYDIRAEEITETEQDDAMVETYREYHIVMSEQRKLRETGYAAITYTDHYSTGIKVEGTEDFTMERWRKQVVDRVVYKPTGKLNKGGHMTWEAVGTVRARNACDCGKIARLVFPGQQISIRQY